MSILAVTIPTPHGDVTMPWDQAMELARRLAAFKAEGVTPAWHPQECGCCVMVHERTDQPRGGWLIGDDGGSEWIANPELS